MMSRNFFYNFPVLNTDDLDRRTE